MSRCTVFVAGTHTEIGKTYVAATLLRSARDAGASVEALKPVVSGFEPSDWRESDPGRLLAAAESPLTDTALDLISPWRFAAPLAPPAAARLEGRALPFAEIRDFVRQRIAVSGADLMVVEGVGGLMSPIAEGATSLDLLLSVGGEVVLVVGSYLGAVSHALTACEVLRARGRTPTALVLSERGVGGEPDLGGTLELLEEHVEEIPLYVARHGESVWAQTLMRNLPAASRFRPLRT